MPLRLSDPNHTKIIELSGTKIHIRSLTNVQKMKMGLLWRSDGIPLTGVEDVDKSVIAHEYTEKLVANKLQGSSRSHSTGNRQDRRL
jgi:hypothetical protein